MNDFAELQRRVEALERRAKDYDALATMARRAVLMFVRALELCFPPREKR